jgi:hypothetical protein
LRVPEQFHASPGYELVSVTSRHLRWRHSPWFMCSRLLRSEAGIWACRLAAELNVVVRATPFHSMTDAGIRPLPEATMVRVEAPTVLVLGLILLSVGAGF